MKCEYRVAMLCKLFRNVGLFYKRALQKRLVFFKRDLYFKGAYKELPPHSMPGVLQRISQGTHRTESCHIGMSHVT